MRISRVIIKNFRNFKHLDVELGQNVVLLGENGVGKTNFLEALRLVLDPTRERRLYRDDFNYSCTPFKGSKIEVHIYFTDFAADPKLLGNVFRDCIIQDDPPIAQVSYVYCPKDNTTPQDAEGRDDYRAVTYGRGDITNDVRGIRNHLSLRVIPALRDIDRDIAVWQNSPLRRLVDLMNLSDDPDFVSVAQAVGRATQALQKIPRIDELKKGIKNRLIEMVEGVYGFDPQIGMLPSNPDELQRALRLFIDENLSLKRSSLGLANVLYLTLLMLEIEQREKQVAEDEDEGEKYQFIILAVEEPEAHLHPHLQRLVFGDFLRRRPPILLSTHSPQIVSVAEPDSLILLKDCGEKGTKATSTAALSRLPDWKPDWDSIKRDLERYLDATRGEVVFAKGVILVEGDAELFLVPAFAQAMKNAGLISCTVDGAGISVCNVAGTDFVPYVRFLGPSGLDLPLVIMTDGDKYVGLKRKVRKLLKSDDVDETVEQNIKQLCDLEDWDTLRYELENLRYGVYEGLNRGIELASFLRPHVDEDFILQHVTCQKSSGELSPFVPGLRSQYNEGRWDQVRTALSKVGIFVNDWTLEAELIAAGYCDELVSVYGALGASDEQQNNMKGQLLSGTTQDVLKFINRVEETGKGKGRFAQRLADKVDSDRVPLYIKLAIKRIVEKVAPVLPVFEASQLNDAEVDETEKEKGIVRVS